MLFTNHCFKSRGDAIYRFETHKFKGKEEHPNLLIWGFCYFIKNILYNPTWPWRHEIFNTSQRLKKMEHYEFFHVLKDKDREEKNKIEDLNYYT